MVGAGKAAVPMTAALLKDYRASVRGVVVGVRGQMPYPLPALGDIEVREAGHPVPDAASAAAGRRVLEVVQGLAPADRLIVLLSGGGSSLLVQPAPGLTLADKQQVTRELLRCGADISAVNCVRKKLSAIKAGRLALAAAPAEVMVLAISDVPGDDIADIASGPCSPDTTTLEDARRILTRHGCKVPDAVQRFLADVAHETPKPAHPDLARVTARICARSGDALRAAAAYLRGRGYTAVLLGDAISAPARTLAREHARLARAYARRSARCALISGGEATVRVVNREGRGGRNTEYLLALALQLQGADAIAALAADTDGIDGVGGHAGAMLMPDSLRRAVGLGLDPAGLLERNCSRDFFAALDDLIFTGPTGTNVSDLRVILTGCLP